MRTTEVTRTGMQNCFFREINWIFCVHVLRFLTLNPTPILKRNINLRSFGLELSNIV